MKLPTHTDDIAVDQFAAAMKAKLAACRAKGLTGWSNPGDPTDNQLARLLTQNMTKGNAGTFVDVANFCMFLHQRGADPVTLASAAFYAPATNYQRNILLAAMQEVREALQLANDSPGGIITDTIWIPHRPETLLDFIDATITPLLPESKAENGNLASTYSLQPLGGEELVEVMEERAQAAESVQDRTVQTVLDELERATRKFPTWPTDPLHALAVLGEEFGELTKDVLQMAYEPGKTNTENVRKEAIQTAAMALRFVASLDNYIYQAHEQHQQA